VHPVTLDPRFVEPSGSALLRLQERLRGLCIGKTLAEARTDLTRLWAEQEARLDRQLAESLRLGLWLCSAAALDPLWVQIAGQRLLTGQSGQTLAQILTLFDDYHGLADLLCQLLPERSGSPRAEIHVAAELPPSLPSGLSASAPSILPPNLSIFDAQGEEGATVSVVLSGLSLVGCRVQPSDEDGHKTAAVALLGPDRMDYEAVIPLVEYAAQALAARTSE
jgi:transcriptional regulator of heat shock response